MYEKASPLPLFFSCPLSFFFLNAYFWHFALLKNVRNTVPFFLSETFLQSSWYLAFSQTRRWRWTVNYLKRNVSPKFFCWERPSTPSYYISSGLEFLCDGNRVEHTSVQRVSTVPISTACCVCLCACDHNTATRTDWQAGCGSKHAGVTDTMDRRSSVFI